MPIFEKKTCERCGKQYSIRTTSENRGKHICRDCLKLCSTCGKKLPQSNMLGQSCSLTTAVFGTFHDQRNEFTQKPWIGSGKCDECYWKEQDLLKQAELRQAREIVETPTIWECEYCKTVNRGNFCSNCGGPRHKVRGASSEMSHRSIDLESMK